MRDDVEVSDPSAGRPGLPSCSEAEARKWSQVFELLASVSNRVDWKTYYLSKFGSAEAIEMETEQERSLELALEPWKVTKECVDPNTNETYNLVSYRKLENDPYRYEDLDPDIVQAVSQAYPVPADLRGVLKERQAWDDLGAARWHVLEWVMMPCVRARELVLEEILSTRPAATLDDIAARIDWWHSRATDDFHPGNDFHNRIHKRLQLDFAAVAGLTADDAA